LWLCLTFKCIWTYVPRSCSPWAATHHTSYIGPVAHHTNMGRQRHLAQLQWPPEYNPGCKK
jgi:hypothetical protein